MRKTTHESRDDSGFQRKDSKELKQRKLREKTGWFFNPATNLNHFIPNQSTKTLCNHNIDPILPPKADDINLWCNECVKNYAAIENKFYIVPSAIAHTHT